jgi:acyl-CoA thioester hydrolase
MALAGSGSVEDEARSLAASGPGDFPFACLFRVRYSEIDGQQIVFNAHYLTWFDTALSEYFRHLGILYGSSREGAEPVDFHTVRNLIDYHAPIRFDEVIAVAARPGRIGRSSVTFELAIFARGETRPRASGQVVWVCAGIGDHRSQPIPDAMRMRFEGARTAARVEIDPVQL